MSNGSVPSLATLTRKFLFSSPHFFNPPKRNMRMRREIFELKPSINMNRIFEKFGKYLPKFCDIETSVSTVYFSKNSKIMFFRFYVFNFSPNAI
jgi:hypothetical protein